MRTADRGLVTPEQLGCKAISFADLGSAWRTYQAGQWVQCTGRCDLNRRRERDLGTGTRRCDRTFLRVGRNVQKQARIVGVRRKGDRPGPPPEVDGDLHYCHDCGTYTELRDMQVAS